MKDWNYIAAMEKAISKKYGHSAIINPKSNWDEEKEKEYDIQEKLLRNKIEVIESLEEKVEEDGFLIAESRKDFCSNRECSVCNTYSFKIKDDIYMNKFDCCSSCYILYVEGRERRWEEGWRPI